ncbi:hypothetical protein AJ87_41040 [Rhizobium yanglingense]|nr:hypothetical protein AJ87_41040 [Rhizobium yanglingense]
MTLTFFRFLRFVSGASYMVDVNNDAVDTTDGGGQTMIINNAPPGARPVEMLEEGSARWLVTATKSKAIRSKRKLT